MNEREFRLRMQEGLGDERLWAARTSSATAAGRALAKLGEGMIRRAPAAPAAANELRAMGSILRMGGELVEAAGELLGKNSQYAGSALLRQIVEIEYLTWTFRKGHENPAAWLASSRSDRLKDFSPKKLRRNAQGRYLEKDYQEHCERGGHPVPTGIPLLGGSEISLGQMALVDLLLHCWRTWDNVRYWTRHHEYAAQIGAAPAERNLAQLLQAWGEIDPLYALMVDAAPDRDSRSE